MADHLQVDYDQMSSMAQACDQQGQEAEQMLRAITNQVENLRAGGWVGAGADAFYAEMDDLMLPALNRLLAALQQAADIVRAVGYEFSEAEQETARLFSGQGAAAQAGDHVGNFNFKVEVDGAVHGGGSLGVKIEHDTFKAADTGSQDFKVEGSQAESIGANQSFKVEGSAAQQVGGSAAEQVGGNQDYKVGGSSSQQVGGSQDFKVEGNPAASQVNKFPDMPGGGGGGSTPPTNTPDVVKFPGTPAPPMPGPPDSASVANKFTPGSQSNKFDGLDDVDETAHKI